MGWCCSRTYVVVLCDIPCSIACSLLLNCFADVFGKRYHFLLLQSAANDLDAHVRAVVDFGVVCKYKEAWLANPCSNTFKPPASEKTGAFWATHKAPGSSDPSRQTAETPQPSHQSPYPPS